MIARSSRCPTFILPRSHYCAACRPRDGAILDEMRSYPSRCSHAEHAPRYTEAVLAVHQYSAIGGLCHTVRGKQRLDGQGQPNGTNDGDGWRATVVSEPTAAAPKGWGHVGQVFSLALRRTPFGECAHTISRRIAIHFDPAPDAFLLHISGLRRFQLVWGCTTNTSDLDTITHSKQHGFRGRSIGVGRLCSGHRGRYRLAAGRPSVRHRQDPVAGPILELTHRSNNRPPHPFQPKRSVGIVLF